jgi:methionyl-tRNA formyltransferase
MRIIFAGSGEFGLPSLKEIRAAGHEIVQVFTQPDRPAGRGRKMTPTPIGAYADAEKLPVRRTENINAEHLPACDVMVVIAFGQKIAPAVVNHPRFASVNLHASRLPKYRGAAPIHWAILNGETVTGNSIIRLAEKMDAGAVLAQSSLDIGELETTGELHDRLAADGAGLMVKVLEQLESGTAVETPQDEALATIAKKLNREASKIDFTRSAVEIARQIRGMYPWPGCRVKLLDGEREIARVTLVRARALTPSPTGGGPARGGASSRESLDVRERPLPNPPPGGEGTGKASSNPFPDSSLGSIDDAGKIRTGIGHLEIVELQPEGKRPMSLRDFQNGYPWKPGMRLEPIA